jgi:hypothetical protein
MTAAVQLTNKSADYVFVLLMGRPSAVDDAGGVFNETEAVSGVAYCSGTQNPPSKTVCVGKPMNQYTAPVDSYTEIEPGKSAAFNIVMRATGGSRGEKIFLTQEVAYRVVKEADLEKDTALPVREKLRTVHFGSLSFSASPGLTPSVHSLIYFDQTR